MGTYDMVLGAARRLAHDSEYRTASNIMRWGFAKATQFRLGARIDQDVGTEWARAILDRAKELDNER